MCPWIPPESAEEDREIRKSYVTPARAAAIRKELEAEAKARARYPDGRACGLPAGARCYLPATRCCSAP